MDGENEWVTGGGSVKTTGMPCFSTPEGPSPSQSQPAGGRLPALDLLESAGCTYKTSSAGLTTLSKPVSHSTWDFPPENF